MRKQELINKFSEYFENSILSKLIISKINIENTIITIFSDISDLKKITLSPYLSKQDLKIKAVASYPTKEESKILSLNEAKSLLENLIFLQADLFSINYSHHLLISKNGKQTLLTKQLKTQNAINTEHNKTKTYLIPDSPTPFLIKLGVQNQDGFLIKDKREKFKQLNKFIEFFAQGLKEANLNSDIQVLDMGSGKAYLTFAMQHFLTKNDNIKAHITGVELRQDMVELCNKHAADLNLSNLTFTKGHISNFIPETKPNVLVALHACDTATDDALYLAINQKIELIMVAPCCHKQVRKSLHGKDTFSIFEKFGTVKERFSETLTDLIRGMVLEAYGYETKIFEFIGAENTPKNMMITGVLKKKPELSKLQKIKDIMTEVGLEKHYLLETLE